MMIFVTILLMICIWSLPLAFLFEEFFWNGEIFIFICLIAWAGLGTIIVLSGMGII